jgi:isoleucyl-tRNA synthetase
MNKFEELDKRKASEVEKDLVKYWKENKVFEKSIENREGKKDFVFYDGPIYANAKPGIHHVFAKTIKDTFCKYKTMQGYRVLKLDLILTDFLLK